MHRKAVIVLRIIAVAWLLASNAALADPPKPKEAVAAVAKLYRDYAWEAVVEEPNFDDAGLLEQSESVLARYFDKQMVSLILRDKRCALAHGSCRLDFDPIWNSQDPMAKELKVLPTDDPATVSVQFVYAGDNTPIKLTYRLIQTGGGWKITDIIGTYGSLRGILESNFQP